MEEVIRALGRIEGDTKGLRGEFAGLRAAILSLEKRVREVERFQDRMLAYAAGAGAVAGFVLTIVGRWLV